MNVPYPGMSRLPQPIGRQHEVLYLPAGGHTVVLGTAGSGKTTMAMHRAVHLANRGLPHAGRTLLLSFNNTLVRYFESFVGGGAVDVDARTYHHFARGYLDTCGRMSYGAICTPEERLSQIELAVGAALSEAPAEPALRRPIPFLAEELKWLAQHEIRSEAEYVDSERTGRQGARLPRKERAVVFRLCERYRAMRSLAGKQYDWDDLALAVVDAAAVDSRPRLYRHIVIDEGQDFSPAMLRSLVNLLPPDGSLTFFGDMAQQIYGNRMSWRTAGLSVQKVWQFQENYRNTKQIANLALAISANFAQRVDLVSPTAPTADGALPALVSFSSEVTEMNSVCQWANRLGKTQSVAILLTTRDEEDELRRRLSPSAIRLHRDMQGWSPGSGVFYGTYAAAKGLEFDAVILPRISTTRLPTPEDLATYGQDEAEAIAGHLLYVGVTRARVTLIISATGADSGLLPSNAGLLQRSSA